MFITPRAVLGQKRKAHSWEVASPKANHLHMNPHPPLGLGEGLGRQESTMTLLATRYSRPVFMSEFIEIGNL